MCPDSQQDAGTGRSDPAGGACNGNGADSDPFRDLAELFNERFALLSRSIRTLIAVHTDRAQLALRRRVQLAILAMAAVFAGSTAIVYAVVLVMRGTVLGLTTLFDGRTWLGTLAAGVLVLALVGGGVFLALRRWNRSQLKKQEVKYAELRKKRDSVARRPPF